MLWLYLMVNSWNDNPGGPRSLLILWKRSIRRGIYTDYIYYTVPLGRACLSLGLLSYRGNRIKDLPELNLWLQNTPLHQDSLLKYKYKQVSPQLLYNVKPYN